VVILLLWIEQQILRPQADGLARLVRASPGIPPWKSAGLAPERMARHALV